MHVRVDTTPSAAGRTDPTDSRPDGTVWRAHPLVARALRYTAVLLPVAASFAVVYLLDHALPSPGSWAGFAVIAGVDVVATLGTVFVVYRIGMRLLPLATLLSLSLVFPDQAPARFAIALRANSTAQLRLRMTASRVGMDVTTAVEDLLTFLAALSRHDRVTRGHCERVRAFVDLLAVQMDLSATDQDRLRWAALLHDIGKLRVPGRILRKPGKPTDEEWETLRRHPLDGAELIEPLAPWLGPWAVAVEQHHERFDGRGYPMGLAGSDISLGGRILAVADAYEVMVTSRPYKRPVRPEAARRELVRHAGQQFDPDTVRAFLGIAIGDLRRAMGLLGVLSEVPLLATVPRAGALAEMAGRQTIAMMGAAAGTGALAAVATVSPIHLPAASPFSAGIEVTQPASHTSLDGTDRSPATSLHGSPHSSAPASNDGSSSAQPDLVPNTEQAAVTVAHVASGSLSGSGLSVSINGAGTGARLTADESNLPTVGSDSPVPDSVRSTTRAVGAVVDSPVDKEASTAGSTADDVVPTDESTADEVASAVASTTENVTEGLGRG